MSEFFVILQPVLVMNHFLSIWLQKDAIFNIIPLANSSNPSLIIEAFGSERTKTLPHLLFASSSN